MLWLLLGGGITKQKGGLERADGWEERGSKRQAGDSSVLMVFTLTPAALGWCLCRNRGWKHPSPLLRRTSSSWGKSSTNENPSLALPGGQTLLLPDGEKAEVLSARDLNLSSGQF